MSKKGFSLIELVVSMSIFIVITSLVIGGFVTVSRMKSLASIAKESQQKTRIAQEMITRLSRQAERVIVKDITLGKGKTLELYFNIKEDTPYGVRFKIDDTGKRLLYSECSGSINCAFGPDRDLYSGISLQPDSYFLRSGSIPPTLQVKLTGKIDGMSNNFFSDEITLDMKIVLERIR